MRPTITAALIALGITTAAHAEDASGPRYEGHAAYVAKLETSIRGTTLHFDCPTCPGPTPFTVFTPRVPTDVLVGQYVVLVDDPYAEGLKLVHIDWDPRP